MERLKIRQLTSPCCFLCGRYPEHPDEIWWGTADGDFCSSGCAVEMHDRYEEQERKDLVFAITKLEEMWRQGRGQGRR